MTHTHHIAASIPHSDVRAFLKLSTRTLHIEVERSLDLPTHLRDVAGYRALLARFFGFYQPIEEKLSRVPGLAEIGLDFAARRKLPLLRGDLSTLGMDATALRILPVCRDLPVVENLTDGLGCLYVLEGSTLGGQVISRMIAGRLGFTPSVGATFFASYGERVEPMWNQLCAALEAHAGARHVRQEALLAAAQSTFRSFGAWLVGARS